MATVSDWYTLKASDIISITTGVNVDIVRFIKPTNYAYYGVYGIGAIRGSVASPNYRNDIGIDLTSRAWNNTNYIGILHGQLTVNNFDLIVAKGTYADLAAAQAALAGTQILYQLATPIPTKYKDPGQLYAEPNGTIIAEAVAHGRKSPEFGTGKIVVTTADAPISGIDSVIRFDVDKDGNEIMVDVTSSFTPGADKLSIIGTGTDPSKVYEYVCPIDPAYSTVPQITYSYPEAVIQDWAVASHDYGGAAADWTLTTSEAQCEILYLTNAGGAANAIAPAITRPYTVINQSGYAITVKVSGGTGVTVANGTTAMVAYVNGSYVKLF